MELNNLINVDYFKKSYYKAFLPLNQINAFLQLFDERELDGVNKTIVALFDTAVTKTIVATLETTADKQEFLRLAQDDYSSPAILDFLIDKFPGSEELILQTLERTLLSAKKAIL